MYSSTRIHRLKALFSTKFRNLNNKKLRQNIDRPPIFCYNYVIKVAEDMKSMVNLILTHFSENEPTTAFYEMFIEDLAALSNDELAIAEDVFKNLSLS